MQVSKCSVEDYSSGLHTLIVTLQSANPTNISPFSGKHVPLFAGLMKSHLKLIGLHSNRK